jgi:RND family efflux transporter MFP subunit
MFNGRHVHANISGMRDNESAKVLPVSIVHPQRKVLLRTLDQPGTIKPWAEAELYARVPGYLRWIAREPDRPEQAVDLVVRNLSAVTWPYSSVSSAVALAANGHAWLWQLPQKDLGSRVQAGEVLLRIDVPELEQDVLQKASRCHEAEAELQQARANLGTFEAAVQLSSLQLARLRDLAKNNTVTKEIADEKQAELSSVSSKLAAARAEILVREARLRVAQDELRRAQIMADFAEIRAPFDGIITFRGVDEGDFVQNASSGQTRQLLSIADIHRVKIVLQVPEREAGFVQTGAPALVRVDALDKWEVSGKVARVSHALDQQSRTRQVEVDLDNRDGKLLPGMYGVVALEVQRIDKALAIPATAVHSQRGENFILVVRDGIAHRQKVRILFDDGKELQVVKLVGKREEPLNGMEELIVSNKGEIAEGQRVRAARVVQQVAAGR